MTFRVPLFALGYAQGFWGAAQGVKAHRRWGGAATAHQTAEPESAIRFYLTLTDWSGLK